MGWPWWRYQARCDVRLFGGDRDRFKVLTMWSKVTKGSSMYIWGVKTRSGVSEAQQRSMSEVVCSR
jgi:hypothetical protein